MDTTLIVDAVLKRKLAARQVTLQVFLRSLLILLVSIILVLVLAEIHPELEHFMLVMNLHHVVFIRNHVSLRLAD